MLAGELHRRVQSLVVAVESVEPFNWFVVYSLRREVIDSRYFLVFRFKGFVRIELGPVCWPKRFYFFGIHIFRRFGHLFIRLCEISTLFHFTPNFILQNLQQPLPHLRTIQDYVPREISQAQNFNVNVTCSRIKTGLELLLKNANLSNH